MYIPYFLWIQLSVQKVGFKLRCLFGWCSTCCKYTNSYFVFFRVRYHRSEKAVVTCIFFNFSRNAMPFQQRSCLFLVSSHQQYTDSNWWCFSSSHPNGCVVRESLFRYRWFDNLCDGLCFSTENRTNKLLLFRSPKTVNLGKSAAWKGHAWKRQRKWADAPHNSVNTKGAVHGAEDLPPESTGCCGEGAAPELWLWFSFIRMCINHFFNQARPVWMPVLKQSRWVLPPQSLICYREADNKQQGNKPDNFRWQMLRWRKHQESQKLSLQNLALWPRVS